MEKNETGGERIRPTRPKTRDLSPEVKRAKGRRRRQNRKRREEAVGGRAPTPMTKEQSKNRYDELQHVLRARKRERDNLKRVRRTALERGYVDEVREINEQLEGLEKDIDRLQGQLRRARTRVFGEAPPQAEA